VVSIFKYLDIGNIILLVILHFAICVFSFTSVWKSVRNQVFKTEQADEDIDFVVRLEVKSDDQG
ncbi:MAG: hypothetical protein IJV68_03870, partial [Clostridia bacterium]|nr:hypothetical protein [Clostridia bacterium]